MSCSAHKPNATERKNKTRRESAIPPLFFGNSEKMTEEKIKVAKMTEKIQKVAKTD